MPTYYENHVATFENSVTREEYLQAWMLDQAVNGRLRNRGGKTILLAVVAALCLFYMPYYSSLYGTVWIPAGVAAACVLAAAYYQVWLTHWAQKRAAVCFESNRLLSQTAQVSLYRDSYTVENEYEELQGHWTDNTACVETGELFVITGGWDRPLLVIPKHNVGPEQVQQVSEHFERTFVKKYVRKG